MDALLSSPFDQLAALLALSALAGLVGLWLRQPLIVSFIVVGLLAGPSALGLVRSEEPFGMLAELGIALLLFLVGIKLDVKLVRSLGAVALFTGLGQVVFTSLFGYVIGLGVGLEHMASLYVAVALTFSSTIIIVKLLSDKREIDALHGQIAVGFLIVQDLVVVVAMVVLSAVGLGQGAAGRGALDNLLLLLLAGAGMVVLTLVFARHVANPLTRRLAQAPEVLLVVVLAMAALFAWLGNLVGLGKEVGGLLAGVALASTAYRETIAARLGPLRDFLLLFFFITLGTSLDLSRMGAHVVGASLFSIFVLVGNPLIVLAIMGALGYRKRTGFLAGLTVGQISEFSLIFVAMGVSLGHVGEDALGLVTLVGLVTITASTYMITYSHEIYGRLERFLGIFERSPAVREVSTGDDFGEEPPVMLVLGLGRFGTALGVRLKNRGIRALGVDFNPSAVRRWRALGLDARYGDVTDPEFIADLPLSDARWLVSTIPAHPTGLSHEDTRRTLVQLARTTGFAGRVALTSHSTAESVAMRAAGADIVLEPFQDAADQAVDLLCGVPAPIRIEIPGIESE